MSWADTQLMAPPGGQNSPAFLQWTAVGFGLWLLFAVVATWESRRRKKKLPVEQRVDVLREELRTGTPNARGHIRVDPVGYPGISVSQAEDVAREEGFLRQSQGAKGQWLFYRVGTQPGSSTGIDVRGGPAPEVVRESAAARRVAEEFRTQDGFDPLDETTLATAEKELRTARARSDRATVRCALALLGWVFAEILARFAWGEWPLYAAFQICAATLLIVGVRMLIRARRLRAEGRRKDGVVLAAYRDTVAAQADEKKSRREPE